ncbi:helix-turn-helix transcriptional regulator [Streptacidiphilus sp. P02-A3a]|nr:helix-turn-helix transcriptional regulator [Streptacidiphilus sp. P02-A3a]
MSQRDLAAAMQESQGTILRWEKGRRTPSLAQARLLDQVLRTDGLFEGLHPLWLQHAHPSWFGAYVEMEQRATEARIFEPQIIPALFQTEDYARATLAQLRPDQDRLEDLLTARMSRQEILGRDDRLRVWAVMDESVLGRALGGPEVMSAQLERLLREGEHPRTVIQVVPSTTHDRPGLSGAFTVLTLSQHNGALYADGFLQGRTSADQADVIQGRHAYDLLVSAAQPVGRSADMIRDYLKGDKW